VLWTVAAVLAVAGVFAGVWSYSVHACDDFPSFDARGPDVPPDVAQQRAQEWADGLSSSLGCELRWVQASNGFVRAHYQEPPPIVAPALAVVSGTLGVGAVAASTLAWARRRRDQPAAR
jgi:hypothetical protein